MNYLPDVLMWLSWMFGYAALLFGGLAIVSVIMLGLSLCQTAKQPEDRQ
jgi:hypothetical protein